MTPDRISILVLLAALYVYLGSPGWAELARSERERRARRRAERWAHRAVKG